MAKWGGLKVESICHQCKQPFKRNGMCGCDSAKWDTEKLRCETAEWLQKNATPKGYAPLRRVLDLALAQASSGKGAERHANGLPFDAQPMLEIGRMVGMGFCLGQAMKKAQEASRMQPDAAKRELLGAINYLAGAYLLLEENEAT